MMDDLYVEQLVEKEETKKDVFKKIGIVVIACIVSMLLSSQWLFKDPIHASPLIIVVAIIASYFFKRLNIEYEYLFTNGTLDIDCIYNRSKRKNIFSVVEPPEKCYNTLMLYHHFTRGKEDEPRKNKFSGSRLRLS